MPPVSKVPRYPSLLDAPNESLPIEPERIASLGTKLMVPPAEDCPDAVFVEDTVVMFRNVAVITRPGADERKPAGAVERDGEPIVELPVVTQHVVGAIGDQDGGGLQTGA